MSYVTAILKIPIEIVDDKPNLLTNYTEVEFEKCEKLPSETNNPNSMIMEKLQLFLDQQCYQLESKPKPQTEDIINQENEKKDISSQIFENLELFVNKSEIHPTTKRSKNTSFKNNSNIKNTKKFTLKSRPLFP
jgi:hypothetical protein